MFEEDKDGNRTNDCENCPAEKRANLLCGFEPVEYAAAKVPIDLRGDHAEVEKWALGIEERSFEQEEALEAAQAYIYLRPNDDREACFKLKAENRFAMRYILGYRTDGQGAPRYRVSGGTYDQIQRDIEADSLICGVMIDGKRRRASEAGSAG